MRGPDGYAAARGPEGGVAAKGPEGYRAAVGPEGGVAARGPEGNTVVGYRGEAVGGWGPYYGPPAGAVAAGVAVGVAARNAAIVSSLPDTYQVVDVNDQMYYTDGTTYYQPCYQGVDVNYCPVDAPQ